MHIELCNTLPKDEMILRNRLLPEFRIKITETEK